MLVAALKDSWDALDSEGAEGKFMEKWTELFTQETCVGPKSWEEDIGHSHFAWSCNATCQASTGLCHEGRAIDKLRENVAEVDGRWPNLAEQTDCEAYGGVFTDDKRGGDSGTNQCQGLDFTGIAGADKLPCTERDECQSECTRPCNSYTACIEGGGAWMPYTTTASDDSDGSNGTALAPEDQEGMCCPAGKFVYTSPENGYKECLNAPRTSIVAAWQVQDATCWLARRLTNRRTCDY